VICLLEEMLERCDAGADAACLADLAGRCMAESARNRPAFIEIHDELKQLLKRMGSGR
jgi:hypothetical protein